MTTETKQDSKPFAIYLTKSTGELVTLVLLIEPTDRERAEVLNSVKNPVMYWAGDSRDEFDKALDGLIAMLEVTDEIDLSPAAE